jgi:hypothetical protein
VQTNRRTSVSAFVPFTFVAPTIRKIQVVQTRTRFIECWAKILGEAHISGALTAFGFRTGYETFAVKKTRKPTGVICG